MAVEIERKFLVDKEKWDALPKPKSNFIRQGYIITDPEKTIRIRISGDEAFLTIKGETTGFSRTEIECNIPVAAAAEMLQHFSTAEIHKERYNISYGQHTWEVDVFHGKNEGLIIAEIELESESDVFEKPDWLAGEVTGDLRYYNSNLSLNPFLSW